MPASSPSDASAISTSNPRRCAQRRYIRRRISAQSCESVPPGAAVHRNRRVAGVVPALEQALLLECVHAALGDAQLLAELGLERFVLGGQLGQAGEVLDVRLQRAVGLELPRRTAVLGGHRCGPLLVVPEAGLAHLAPRASRRSAPAQRGQR